MADTEYKKVPITENGQDPSKYIFVASIENNSHGK